MAAEAGLPVTTPCPQQLPDTAFFLFSGTRGWLTKAWRGWDAGPVLPVEVAFLFLALGRRLEVQPCPAEDKNRANTVLRVLFLVGTMRLC